MNNIMGSVGNHVSSAMMISNINVPTLTNRTFTSSSISGASGTTFQWSDFLTNEPKSPAFDKASDKLKRMLRKLL